jgi:ubiquinone biosynthesis protein
MELITTELGTSIETYFQKIDKECIGSASIGQVYKGILKNGEQVVLKIQRPDIREKIKIDLQLLDFAAGKLAKEYPELVVVDLKGLVKEFGEMMMNELNYFNEAANAIRFGEMFRDVPYCKIPKVYTDISTSKLLVLEYIDGIIPYNASVLEQHALNPNEVVSNGTNIFLKMIFEHGFFHADPHVGNLFIQQNNRVALIDFGMAGSLKPSHMQFLAGFTLGLATGNAETISNALLQLNANNKFFKEREDLNFHVQEMLNRYSSMKYEYIKFSQVLDECVRILLRFDMKIPSTIFLLLKALAYLEKLGQNLNSKISLASYIKPYAIGLIKKEYSPRELAKDIFQLFKDYITLLKTFPSEVSEILHKAKKGKLTHEIDPNNLEVFHSTLSHAGRRIATVLLVGFMFSGSIVVNAWGSPTIYTEFLFFITSVFGIWLLFKLFFKTIV